MAWQTNQRTNPLHITDVFLDSVYFNSPFITSVKDPYWLQERAHAIFSRPPLPLRNSVTISFNAAFVSCSFSCISFTDFSTFFSTCKICRVALLSVLRRLLAITSSSYPDGGKFKEFSDTVLELEVGEFVDDPSVDTPVSHVVVPGTPFVYTPPIISATLNCISLGFSAPLVPPQVFFTSALYFATDFLLFDFKSNQFFFTCSVANDAPTPKVLYSWCDFVPLFINHSFGFY